MQLTVDAFFLSHSLCEDASEQRQPLSRPILKGVVNIGFKNFLDAFMDDFNRECLRIW